MNSCLLILVTIEIDGSGIIWRDEKMLFLQLLTKLKKQTS